MRIRNRLEGPSEQPPVFEVSIKVRTPAKFANVPEGNERRMQPKEKK